MSQAIPGTAFAVTSTSAGPFTVPASNNVYGWAVVNNCTPWLCQVICADGVITAQPFEAVLVTTPPNGNLSYTMSVPPSGSAVATAGQPVYLQADWYVQASGAPDGTYPMSLTAQAIAAAVTAEFLDTDLTPGGVPGATLSKTVTLPTNTQTIEVLFPSGGATTTCTVTGTTTTQIYGGTPEIFGATGADGRFRFRVSYAADPSVTVAVTNPGGTWWIVASPAVLQVDSINYGVTSTAGTAVGQTGVLVGGHDGTHFQVLSVTAPGAALPSQAQVVQAGSDGTDSRLLSTDSSGHLVLGTHFRPTGLTATGIGASLAAGGTATIVAASAGKTITIYYLQATITAGAATAGTYQVQFEGITSGTIVGAGRPNIVQATAVGIGSAVASIYLDFTGIGGFALTLSEGFEAVAAGGNAGAVVIEGVVIYTQA